MRVALVSESSKFKPQTPNSIQVRRCSYICNVSAPLMYLAYTLLHVNKYVPTK